MLWGGGHSLDLLSCASSLRGSHQTKHTYTDKMTAPFFGSSFFFWPSSDHAPVHEHQRPHQLPPHGQALQHPEEGQEDGGGLPDLGVRREAALKKKVGGWMCMYV